MSGRTSLAVQAFRHPAYLRQRSPDIKTKAELDLRETQRARPVPLLELNPVSHRVTMMKERTDEQNERRINILRQTLTAQRQKLALDHKRAMLKDRAKSAFNREIAR